MAPQEPHVRGYWRRHSAALARWLHIYVSMLSFGLLLFFSVTGLTLNHAEKFGAAARPRQLQGQLTVGWVKTNDAQVARLEIVEHLRRTHGVKGALGDFRIEEAQCNVVFKGPGYSADAVIDRETGAYELIETRLGLIAIVNDLHKGRDTGDAWSWLIDISAVLLTLVSLTGLALMGFIRRRRFSGFVLAVAGTVVIYVIYVLFIP
jgi:uncharacterized protein